MAKFAQSVWYAAYGSNIEERRLADYLERCDDQSPPFAWQPYMFPYRMVFTKEATPRWGEGGVAFLDTSRTVEVGKGAIGRRYLLGWSQFVQIFAQENDFGGDTPLDQVNAIVNGKPVPLHIALDRLLSWQRRQNRDETRKPKTSFPQCLDIVFERPSKGSQAPKCWYARIVLLSDPDDRPTLTFTSHPDSLGIKKPPSEAYVSTIARGLLATYFYQPDHLGRRTEDDIAKYLGRAISGGQDRDVSTIAGRLPDIVRSERQLHLKMVQEDHEGIVIPTADVAHDTDAYIAQLPHAGKYRHGLGRATYIRIHRTAQFVGPKREEVELAVLARLDKSSGITVEEGTIRIDQKLRIALGIRPGDRVQFHAYTRPYRRSMLLHWLHLVPQSIGGERPQLMRVSTARYEDMEIPLCRIPQSSFAPLGIEEGDFVWLESPEKSLRLRAFARTSDMERKRKNNRAVDTKSRDCVRDLAFERLELPNADLPEIWMDLSAREALGVDVCDPVYIYRDNIHQLWKEAHIAAFTVVIGGLFLPLQWEGLPTELRIGITVTALFAAMILVALKVRRQVR